MPENDGRANPLNCSGNQKYVTALSPSTEKGGGTKNCNPCRKQHPKSNQIADFPAAAARLAKTSM